MKLLTTHTVCLRLHEPIELHDHQYTYTTIDHQPGSFAFRPL